MTLVTLQIGKKGLTAEFIINLKKLFETAEHARVSILKSATRDREELKKWADEIVSKLGMNYTCKIIGWTIVLRKWRKGKDMRTA